ncbi:MAG: amino acid--tRNA ligase-related protein, partial [Sulfurimonas sp.]
MRSHYCTDVSEVNVGESVVLTGWANNSRDHGGIVFIDLRDKTGLVQLTCDPEHNAAAHKVANEVRDEFVLIAKGVVRHRGEGLVNPRLKTGTIEIMVTELIIENRSAPVPFVIGDKNVGEETRLRYRYLELRDPDMYETFRLRSKAAIAARNILDANGFLEVETPILTKSTPEGARDYLVPSRVH